MIRIEEPSGWILIRHPDHAKLAAELGGHWGNDSFPRPEPWDDILVAVARHDDAWAERDGTPFVTREGRPSAFSRELVGAYSSFEEISLAEYLGVRGRAADLIAADNPFAALIVSMHTVDLVGGHTDVAALADSDRVLLAGFLDHQRRRQESLRASLGADPTVLRRAFEFLQACDSLSLAICVRYPEAIPLQHEHPDRDGRRHVLTCRPLGNDTYSLSPYPFDADEIVIELPCRRIGVARFAGVAAFREAYAAAPEGSLRVRIVRATSA